MGCLWKEGHLEARFCQFSENASTGIQMYSTDVSCRLYRCYISENKGGGFHGAETRDAMYTDSRQRFISCSFFNNHSQSTGSAIWARSRVYVDNSLFLFNQSEAADGAAIYCMFDGNQFVNCTIMNNKGGVCLSKNFGDRPGGEPDPLLVNCALWNNGEDFVNPFNRTYKLQTCAMQTGGSGIPELDAERGLILLEAENEGTTPGGMYIAFSSVVSNMDQTGWQLFMDRSGRCVPVMIMRSLNRGEEAKILAIISVSNDSRKGIGKGGKLKPVKFLIVVDHCIGHHIRELCENCSTGACGSCGSRLEVITTWSVYLPHFKVPFIDRIAKRVLLKEQVVDFPPQPVITIRNNAD